MNRNSLYVFYGNQKVGRLAQLPDHRVAFEYDPLWIQNGFSISPLSLPLRPGVMISDHYDPFDGLFGVFADSLPGRWGRMLTNRMLKRHGINPESINVLDRLSIVGDSGIGVLEYRPKFQFETESGNPDLEELVKECKRITEGKDDQKQDALQLGYTLGGSRPKACLLLQNQSWIVKFAGLHEPKEIGQEEYDYHSCARECGLNVSEIQLLPLRFHKGYFAFRRFDRSGAEKIHIVSAGTLLETSHHIPDLDYIMLMKLTRFLTRSNADCWQLYDRMCFNVFSHNRDDHAKNFSFLFENGCWHLSPVYDLTYSNSWLGEHATTVNGKGKDIRMEDLLIVAKTGFLDMKEAGQRAAKIKSIVEKRLAFYLNRPSR